MKLNITLAQLGRFLWMAILLQMGVYIITGMICWYRTELTFGQFSIGLSWAGLILLAISGVLFMTAKPKSNRPSMFSGLMPKKRSEKDPLAHLPTFSGNILSSMNPLGKGSNDNDPAEANEEQAEDKELTEAAIEEEKVNRKKLYYYSGMIALVGAMTIASSEYIYRVILTSVK